MNHQCSHLPYINVRSSHLNDVLFLISVSNSALLFFGRLTVSKIRDITDITHAALAHFLNVSYSEVELQLETYLCYTHKK